MRATLGLDDREIRCLVCGELKGEFLYKGSHDPKPVLAQVPCLCDGLVCGNCGHERIHKPISNRYDEDDGRVWHVPYFMGLTKRRVCGVQDWVREYDEARAARKQEARLAAARQHVVLDYTQDLGASSPSRASSSECFGRSTGASRIRRPRCSTSAGPRTLTVPSPRHATGRRGAARAAPLELLRPM